MNLYLKSRAKHAFAGAAIGVAAKIFTHLAFGAIAMGFALGGMLSGNIQFDFDNPLHIGMMIIPGLLGMGMIAGMVCQKDTVKHPNSFGLSALAAYMFL